MDRVLSKLGREEPVGVAMSGMRRPLTDVSRGLAIVDILNGCVKVQGVTLCAIEVFPETSCIQRICIY